MAEPARPIDLNDRAASDLRYIRSAMERASSFTAVPGYGGVGMGVIAVVAAVLAARTTSDADWLLVWGLAVVAALLVGIVTIARKARRQRLALAGAVGRRFALSFSAPALVGAILTPILIGRGEVALLPAVWLLSYGAAVVAGGTMSVAAVPLMGAGFLALGIGAGVMPGLGDLFMGLGFGALHIVVGAWIARRHGG